MSSQQNSLLPTSTSSTSQTSNSSSSPATTTPSARYARLAIEETVAALSTDPHNGLRLSRVVTNRGVFGLNELADDDDGDSIFLKFIQQFTGNPMILLLLGSALVSAVMGQWDDAFSITLAIIIVILVAFVQEYRSEKSLEALNKLVPHHCHVTRDGQQFTVDAAELVPGDLVHFTVGDRVPADVRLTQAINLEIDESNLTGETRPRSKHSDTIRKDTYTELGLEERKNIAFMGTLVRSGHAKGIVVGTGKDTEFGVVFCMMKEVEVRKTPLQLSMDALGKQLSSFSMCIIAVIILIGLLQGQKFLKMFNIGVSLAVAAIPEGLPIVVTVTLALGVLRMANRQVIVKKLPSVETLGSMTVICADKTGTLTLNRMTVTHLYTAAGDHLVDLEKSNVSASRDIEKMSPLVMLLKVGSVCNNAYRDEKNQFLGQSTDIALLEIAYKLLHEDCRSNFERLSEETFSSETKYMSVACRHPLDSIPFRPSTTQTSALNTFAINPKHETGAASNKSRPTTPIPPGSPLSGLEQGHDQQSSTKTTTMFFKGAIEIIIARCQSYYLSPTQKTSFDERAKQSSILHANELASQGLRILAVAFGNDEKNLTFVGLFAMYDPPRKGIDQAIGQLIAGRVKTVMITGDAEGTAKSIARKLGIPILRSESCMTGAQLDTLSERQLQEVIKNVSVFARTTPKHKMAIVRAFQAAGEVVAMTGDGVNDAPALKLADIGIAMGKSGTDVAKEAADMILVDDDFQMILAAIEEGKSIYYNIQNFLRFQLSTAISALALIAVSTFFGLDNPLNAMQILWINILMDGPPAQSLGVEPVDHDVMRKPPRPRDDTMLTRSLIIRLLTSAVIIVMGTMFVYVSEMQDGVVSARDTTMTFTTFVLFDMFNALSCRSERKSIFVVGFFSNRMFNIAVALSLVGQLLVIYTPFLQRVFITEALHLSDLIRLVLLTSSVFWVDEARKWYAWRLGKGEYEKIPGYEIV